MNKTLSHTVRGQVPKRDKRRPKWLPVTSILLAITAWLAFCGVATAGTRTYSVSSVRLKATAPTGFWPPYANGTPRNVERMETVDGRWALETAGPDNEKAEGWLDGKFLDSAGKVIWDGVVGDANVLSTTAPAFVTYSAFAQGVRIYNPGIGSDPVFIDSTASIDQVVQSPDGATFGIVGPKQVTLISVGGHVQGRVAFRADADVLCAAVSDGGQYVAVGQSKLEPEPQSSDSAPQDSYPRISPKKHKPGDTTRLVRPNLPAPRKRKMVRTYQGVTVYDRSGHQLYMTT